MPSTQIRSATPTAQIRSATPTAQFRSAPPTGKFAATPGTTHIHSGNPAFHHHKQFHHHGHKHFHHHGHGHAFVTTGIVFPAYYPFYPYYPYYGYPAPHYAPPPGVWYYCAAYGAYYPYVSECPSGWQVVQPGHY